MAMAVGPPSTGNGKGGPRPAAAKLARLGQGTSSTQCPYFSSEYRASVFLISMRAAIESGILHFARAASIAAMA